MPKSNLQRARKQSKSEKEIKKAVKEAETEEDFLDLPQDENVLDMVFNEYVQKEERERDNKIVNISQGSLAIRGNHKIREKINFNEDNIESYEQSPSNFSPNVIGSKSVSPIEKRRDKLSDSNNQFKLQLNSFHSNFDDNTNLDINFKETYVFKMGNNDFKFSFVDKNGEVAIRYYKCNSDDDSARLKSTVVLLKEFKDFCVIIEDGKSYYNRIIRLRSVDSNKGSIEINCQLKEDYEKFVGKLEKFVKKTSL